MTNEEQNPVQTAQPMQLIGSTRPIVISTKKKKQRKYSRGLRDIQVWGRRMAKVNEDLARAVANGAGAYRKASNQSAGKKRDGAIRDFGLNVAKGIGKALRSSSSVPYDLARATYRRGTRRRLRRQARVMARLNRRLGIR